MLFATCWTIELGLTAGGLVGFGGEEGGRLLLDCEASSVLCNSVASLLRSCDCVCVVEACVPSNSISFRQDPSPNLHRVQDAPAFQRAKQMRSQLFTGHIHRHNARNDREINKRAIVSNFL